MEETYNIRSYIGIGIIGLLLFAWATTAQAVNSHSIEFDGASNQYLSITDANQTGLDITGDITIEAWVKLDAVGDRGIVWKNSPNGNNPGYFMQFEDSSGNMRLHMRVSDGTEIAYTFSNEIFDDDIGAWVHVAATWENGTNTIPTLYVNGTPTGAFFSDATGISGVGTNAEPLLIGRGYVGQNADFTDLDGKLDEVRIWNVVRTAQEIADNYDQEISAQAGLVGYWKVNNDLTDTSGNGNTLTNNNGAVFSTDIPFPLYTPNLDSIIRVSEDSAGTEGNDQSLASTLSGDGFVTSYTSWATNLVANDTNNERDIFVHDVTTGIITNVAVASDGTQGNARSTDSYMSANGRFVTYSSQATNLVANDTNGVFDIFVHDIQTGSTTRVSVDSNGTQANGQSLAPYISEDGRYVTFLSDATNLIANDTNGVRDVFRHDRQTGATIVVSVDSNGVLGNSSQSTAFMDATGRYIVLNSGSTNLVPNDTNGVDDTFVHDTVTGNTALVSVDSNGNQGNAGSGFGTISEDGRYVAFWSHASNLVANDTNGTFDTFLHDTVTGNTTLINAASDGTPSNGSSGFSSLSADGRFVAFNSEGTNVVPGDTNGVRDVFVRDNLTNDVARVSVDANGAEGNGLSNRSFISRDGTRITFDSDASNLVANDTNGERDVFATPNPIFSTTTPNSAPVLDPIGNQSVDEGQLLTFTVTATDPDTGDTLIFSANNVPAGASINATSGVFTWMPDFDDAGSYPGVEIVVTDNGSPAASSSETITITVNDVNRAPILDPIGNQTVNEGQTLTFTLTASDPDGDNFTFSATNTPAGSTFVNGVFTWTPGFNDAGNYDNIEFTVTDDGTPMELDVELITITVGDVNRAPTISNPGPQNILEDEQVTFTITSSDPDGDNVVLSVVNLPSGATFNAGTGVFDWTPNLSQEGIYTVTFISTDDGVPVATSSVDVVITVGDNPTPTEQAEDLVEEVLSYNFPNNIENSYLANLKKVEKFIEQGKITPAINQLLAFINKVEDDFFNGDITQAQRDSLVTAAQNLIDDLQGN